MARLLGEAWIAISPETAAFYPKLKADVDKAVKASAANVQIGIDKGKLDASAEAAAEEAQAVLDAARLELPLTVNAGEALTSAVKAREAMQAVLKKAVLVPLDLDAPALLAKAAVLRAGLARDLAGLKVTPDMSDADIEALIAKARTAESRLDDIFKESGIAVKLNDEGLNAQITAARERLGQLTGKIQEIRLAIHPEDAEALAAVDAMQAKADVLTARAYTVRFKGDMSALNADIAAFGVKAATVGAATAKSGNYEDSMRGLGANYGDLVQSLEALPDTLGNKGLEAQFLALSKDAATFGQALRGAFSEDEILAAYSDLGKLLTRYEDLNKAVTAKTPTSWAKTLSQQLEGALAGDPDLLGGVSGSLDDLGSKLEALFSRVPSGGALETQLRSLQGQLEKLRADSQGIFSDADAAAIAGRYAKVEAALAGAGKELQAKTPTPLATTLSQQLEGTLPGDARQITGVSGSLQDLADKIEALFSRAPSGSALEMELRQLQGQLEKLKTDSQGIFSDQDAAAIAARYARTGDAIFAVQKALGQRTALSGQLSGALTGGPLGSATPLRNLELQVSGLFASGQASGDSGQLKEAADLQKAWLRLKAITSTAFSDADWTDATRQFAALSQSADAFAAKIAPVPQDVADAVRDLMPKIADLRQQLKDIKPDIDPDSAAYAQLLRLYAASTKIRDSLAGIRTGIAADQAEADLIDLTAKAGAFRAAVSSPNVARLDILTATADLDKLTEQVKGIQVRLNTLSRTSLVNASHSQDPEISMLSGTLKDLQAQASKLRATGIVDPADITAVTELSTAVKRVSGAMDTLDGGVAESTKRWGGFVNAILSVTQLHIPLFNGALSDIHLPNFLASASGLHILIEAGVEFAAIWAPALIGVGAFALASAKDFKNVYTQFQAVKSASKATGESIAGIGTQSKGAQQGLKGLSSLMSGGLAAAVKPQVWTLYGEFLTGAAHQTGTFGAAMTKMGQGFDTFGQKILDVVSSSSGGTFWASATRDAGLLGNSLAQFGKIFAGLLKDVPGYAEILIRLGNAILTVVASVVTFGSTFKIAGKPIIAWFLLLHGGIFYIGLVATAIGTLGKALTGGFLTAFRGATAGTAAYSAANKAAIASVEDLNAAVAQAGVTPLDAGALRSAVNKGALPPPAAVSAPALSPGSLQTALRDVTAAGSGAPGVATALAAIHLAAQDDIDDIDAMGPAATATFSTMRQDLVALQAQVLDTAQSWGVLGEMTGKQAAAMETATQMDALMRAANTEAMQAVGAAAAGPATKVEALAAAVTTAGQEATALKAAGTGAAVSIGGAMDETKGRVAKFGAALGTVAGNFANMGSGVKSASSGLLSDIKGVLTGVSGSLGSLGSKAASAGKGVLGWIGSLVGFSGEAAPIAGAVLVVGAAIGLLAYKAATAQTEAQKLTGSLESALKAAPVNQFSTLLASNSVQVRSNLGSTGTAIQSWAKQWEAATGQSVEGTVGLTHALAMLNKAAAAGPPSSGRSVVGVVGHPALAQQTGLTMQARSLASDYGVYQQAALKAQADQGKFNQNLAMLTPIAGSATGAIAALTVAGVTNNQMLDTGKANQQLLAGLVASVTAGYAAMTYGVGGANTALETMNVTTNNAYTAVQNLTSAYATFLGIVTGGASAFTTFENQFLTIAEATGKAVPGASTATQALLNAATTATASTTASTSASKSSTTSAGTGTSASKGTSASNSQGTSSSTGTSSRTGTSTGTTGTTGATASNASTAASTNTNSSTTSNTASNTKSATTSNTTSSSVGSSVSSSLTHPGNTDKTISIGSNGKFKGGGSNALTPSDAFNALSPSSLAAMQAYIQQLQSAQQLFAALQTQATVSGNSPLAQLSLGHAGQDIISQLAAVPGVGQGSETTAFLGTLATQMGYKGNITDFQAIVKWAGSAKGAEADLNKQQQILAITSANLAGDADALSGVMNTQLNGAMSQAIFDAEGGQKAMTAFATAVQDFKASQTTANFNAMEAAGKKVALMLVTMTGSAASAKKQFEVFMAMQGLSVGEADKLWASYKIGASATKAVGDVSTALSVKMSSGLMTALRTTGTAADVSMSQINLLWEKLMHDPHAVVDGNLTITKSAFFTLASQMHLTQGQAKTLWDTLQHFDGANLKTTVTVDVGGEGSIKVTATKLQVPYASLAAQAKAQAITSLFSLQGGKGFAEGGFTKVPGGWGGGDRVPAILEPGELVVPKRAVPAFAGLAKRLGIPGLASGGLAGNATGQQVASAVAFAGDSAAGYAEATGQAFAKSALMTLQAALSTAQASAATSGTQPGGFSGPGGGNAGANAALARSLIPAWSGGAEWTAWNNVAMAECVPLRTRILTQRGWLAHDEVRPGDETIGYDLATGLSRWTRITRVMHYPAQETVRFGNGYWSAECTPGHRWLTERMYRDSRRGGAESVAGESLTELKDRARLDRVILARPAGDGPGLPVTVNEAALLGWVAGDGTVTEARSCPRRPRPAVPPDFRERTREAPFGLRCDGTPKKAPGGAPPKALSELPRNGRQVTALVITQAKERHFPAIEDALSDVPQDQVGRGAVPARPGCLPVRTWRLGTRYSKDLLARAGHPKRDAMRQVLRMSAQQRAAWLDAIIAAEGSRDAGKTVIYQNDGPVADAIELAVYLSGSRPSRTRDVRGDGRNQSIRMTAPTVGGPNRRSFTEDAGIQDTWCVSTEAGTWSAQQDGRVFLTGNSGWNNLATNQSSGAYGIAQALPYTKYPKAGWPNWAGGTSNPTAQITWMASYIRDRYGDPVAAWGHETSQHWYNLGGIARLAAGGLIGPWGGYKPVPAPGSHVPAHHAAPQPPMTAAARAKLEKAHDAAAAAQLVLRKATGARRNAQNLVGHKLALTKLPHLYGLGPHRTAAGVGAEEEINLTSKTALYDTAYSKWAVLRDAYDVLLPGHVAKVAALAAVKKAAAAAEKKAAAAKKAAAKKPAAWKNTGKTDVTDLRAAFSHHDMTAAQKHAWHLLHEKAAKPHSTGGIINEPVLGVGLQTGMPYSFAEHSPEKVTPIGPAAQGMGTNMLQVAVLLAKQNELIARQNQLLAQQPAMLASALSNASTRGKYKA